MGVVRENAFCFYYPDNLDLLAAAGVVLVPFSPVNDARLPEDLDGLYSGTRSVRAPGTTDRPRGISSARPWAAIFICIWAAGRKRPGHWPMPAADTVKRGTLDTWSTPWIPWWAIKIRAIVFTARPRRAWTTWPTSSPPGCPWPSSLWPPGCCPEARRPPAWREGTRHSSPDAGYPEAAFAGGSCLYNSHYATHLISNWTAMILLPRLLSLAVHGMHPTSYPANLTEFDSPRLIDLAASFGKKFHEKHRQPGLVRAGSRRHVSNRVLMPVGCSAGKTARTV
jgi:hypothetical protein